MAPAFLKREWELGSWSIHSTVGRWSKLQSRPTSFWNVSDNPSNFEIPAGSWSSQRVARCLEFIGSSSAMHPLLHTKDNIGKPPSFSRGASPFE